MSTLRVLSPQDQSNGDGSDHTHGRAHELLEMLMRVVQFSPWPSISHLQSHLPPSGGVDASGHPRAGAQGGGAEASSRGSTGGAVGQHDEAAALAGSGSGGAGNECGLRVAQLSHDCMHIIFSLSSWGNRVAPPPLRPRTRG